MPAVQNLTDVLLALVDVEAARRLPHTLPTDREQVLLRMIGWFFVINDSEVQYFELGGHRDRVNDVALQVSFDLNFGEAPL